MAQASGSDYQSWAHLYDAFYQRALGKDYAVETAYIAELIVSRHGAQASVLDVACGTGMHLSLMPSTLTLAGFDLEPSFLEIARRRVPRATFTQGRMEKLSVDTKVDAITCMFSAIGHLSDVSTLRETCRCFAAALVTGGTVIIEPWILPDDWKPDFLQMLCLNEDRLKAARVGRSVRTGNKSTIYYAFAVTDDNSSHAFEETHVLTLFSDAEYREALEEAGFEVERRSTEVFPRGLYVGQLKGARPISGPFVVRPATSNDASACCAVIRDSITHLCELDHCADERYLAAWLSNKTVENVRRWIEQSHFFVAEIDGSILGVAAMLRSGKVTLNYVAPKARYQGISNALICRLEKTAVELGLETITLETTKTALRFYESRGYVRSDESYMLSLTGTPATVLSKRLPPESTG